MCRSSGYWVQGFKCAEIVGMTFLGFFLPSVLPTKRNISAIDFEVAALCSKNLKMESEMTSKSSPKGQMTKAAAARIQSATAKANGGQVAKGSFSSRATSAAARKGK